MKINASPDLDDRPNINALCERAIQVCELRISAEEDFKKTIVNEICEKLRSSCCSESKAFPLIERAIRIIKEHFTKSYLTDQNFCYGLSVANMTEYAKDVEYLGQIMLYIGLWPQHVNATTTWDNRDLTQDPLLTFKQQIVQSTTRLDSARNDLEVAKSYLQ